MSMNLSRKQLLVLETLQRLAHEEGYMPSVRELASALSLSPATTQQHLNALKKKGFITTDGKAHGLRIIKPPSPIAQPSVGSPPDRALAAVRQGLPREALSGHSEVASQNETLSIPIVGLIAAGRPIEAIEAVKNELDTIHVAQALARSGDYALRVEGLSMIEDGILDGDLVLIRPQKKVENGQIAVALLEDGNATLKRIYRENGRIRLQPANRTMEPFYVDSVEIQGRVVGLLRIYS